MSVSLDGSCQVRMEFDCRSPEEAAFALREIGKAIATVGRQLTCGRHHVATTTPRSKVLSQLSEPKAVALKTAATDYFAGKNPSFLETFGAAWQSAAPDTRSSLMPIFSNSISISVNGSQNRAAAFLRQYGESLLQTEEGCMLVTSMIEKMLCNGSVLLMNTADQDFTCEFLFRNISRLNQLNDETVRPQILHSLIAIVATDEEGCCPLAYEMRAKASELINRLS